MEGLYQASFIPPLPPPSMMLPCLAVLSLYMVGGPPPAVVVISDSEPESLVLSDGSPPSTSSSPFSLRAPSTSPPPSPPSPSFPSQCPSPPSPTFPSQCPFPTVHLLASQCPSVGAAPLIGEAPAWWGFSPSPSSSKGPLTPEVSVNPHTPITMVALRSGRDTSRTPVGHGAKHALHRTTPTSSGFKSKRKPKRSKESGQHSYSEGTAEGQHSSLHTTCEDSIQDSGSKSLAEGASVHTGFEDSQGVHDTGNLCGAKVDVGENAFAANTSSEYCVLRGDIDWEERRYSHRFYRGRYVKKWACLFPTCKDKIGDAKLFSRLESFNNHRVKFHSGSSIVFSGLGKVREEISKYLDARVTSVKHVHTVYMKFHRLRIRAGIFFEAELAAACDDHRGLLHALKEEYIAHFKAQGLADYSTRVAGFHVEARHSMSRPPTTCIVCRGELETAIGGGLANEASTFSGGPPDLETATHGGSASEPSEIAVDGGSAAESAAGSASVPSSSGCGADFETALAGGSASVPSCSGAKEPIIEDEVEQVLGVEDEGSPSTPPASTPLSDDVIEDLCDKILSSLPRTRSRGFRVYETRSKVWMKKK